MIFAMNLQLFKMKGVDTFLGSLHYCTNTITITSKTTWGNELQTLNWP